MQRNDITPQLLERLAVLRPPGDAQVISAYLDLDPSEGLAVDTARRSAVTALVDQARRAASKHEHGLSHASRMKLRADLDRIDKLLRERVLEDDLATGAQALAVFACVAAGMLEALRLPLAVRQRAAVARRPMLRPLVEIGPPSRWAVLLTDGDDARLLEGDGDRLQEIDRIRTPLPRRAAHGIWAPDRDDGPVDRDERRHLERALGMLAEHDGPGRYDAIAVGAAPRLWAAVEDRLPRALRERVLGRLDIDADESRPAEVRARVEPLLRDAARERDRRLVALLSGQRAARGLWPSLKALQERRVQTLILAPGPQHPGAACPRCGWASARAGSCPLDGTPLEAEPDLVELAIAEAIVQAADIVALRDPHELGGDGLAVILRYPGAEGFTG
jgi:hypothetical protein